MSKLDKGTFRVKRETLSEGYFFLCSEILVFLLCLSSQLAHVIVWMCLLLVYVYSYGVFRQALFFSNKEPYWGVINDILYKPYWHVYGELFVEHQGGFPVAAIGCIPLLSRLLCVTQDC